MNNEHPVETLMKSTMENLRDMVDVNTVIGDVVETKDGSCIIPISKVSFGFVILIIFSHKVSSKPPSNSLF